MSTRLISTVLAATVLLCAVTCAAEDGAYTTGPAQSAQERTYSATVSYYSFRDQKDFFVFVASAEQADLHIEARYNYEAIDSGSLFAGWKFSGGKKLTWELTPLLGAVFGQKEGIAPGFEAAAGYGIADFYIEAEYVRDLETREDSFFYAWSELGFSPFDWTRLGFVGQRSTVYQSTRDIDRGLFAQLIYRSVTLSAYIFNPDDSDTRFMVFSIGAKF